MCAGQVRQMATPGLRTVRRTFLGTHGQDSLGDPVARWRRLDAEAAGCVERTIVTGISTT